MSLLQSNINAAVQTLQSLNSLQDQVQQASGLLIDALQAGGKVLVCGNGGSAADAMHLATEFVCRYCDDRRPYPAICFNSSGDLTAIGNDYAFTEVFARQVWAFGQPGDVLVVLTTSGNSPNVKRALEVAREKQVRSIALLGKGGGTCKGLADIELIVPGQVTARIQEAHKLLIHTFCESVDLALHPSR